MSSAASSTHYDVLGVAPTATTTEVRDAYRRLAREHHPDRVAAAGLAGASMPAINEAYRVLSDPARRAVYDAGLRGRSAVGPAAPPGRATTPAADDIPTVPVHDTSPARIPWRSLLVVGVVAVVGLVIVAQFTEPGEPPGPDGVVRVGGCVTLESSGFARDAVCVGDPELDVVVEEIVAFSASCPVRTVGYQDRQGLGIVCVAARAEIAD